MRSLLLSILLGVISLSASAQIQSEYSTNYSGNWAELEKEGSVFYIMDVPGEKCQIYKPGYQLWKTVNISVPKDHWLTDIQYVSQYLFDSDDEVEMLIVYYEYIETSSYYYYVYTTQVINENGSVMLNVPKGSYSIIFNTKDAGSKFLVYETDYSVFPYPVKTNVYSIPGTWMGTDNQSIINADQANIKTWPNPSNGNFNLRYTIPGQPRESWFVLYNLDGSEILREPLNPGGDNMKVSRPDLASGQYIYRIITPNYQSKGQKITISK